MGRRRLPANGTQTNFLKLIARLTRLKKILNRLTALLATLHTTFEALRIHSLVSSQQHLCYCVNRTEYIKYYRKKMTLISSSSNLSGCAKALCPSTYCTKVLSNYIYAVVMSPTKEFTTIYSQRICGECRRSPSLGRDLEFFGDSTFCATRKSAHDFSD